MLHCNIYNYSNIIKLLLEGIFDVNIRMGSFILSGQDMPVRHRLPGCTSFSVREEGNKKVRHQNDKKK